MRVDRKLISSVGPIRVYELSLVSDNSIDFSKTETLDYIDRLFKTEIEGITGNDTYKVYVPYKDKAEHLSRLVIVENAN